VNDSFVVVGASLAGLRAVEAARREGFSGRVTLIGAEPHLPYDRPPLSKEFLEPEAEERYFAEEAHLRDDLGVELLLGEPARTLDPAGRRVLTDTRTVPFDTLVIATGSTPRTLPGGAGITLRTLDDARRLRTHLHTGARVLVVGAGFIGSEIASAARKLGNRVTVVEAAPVPLIRAAGPELGPALAALHRRHGTDLRLGVSVDRVRGRHVDLSDGTTLEVDLVVVGIGARPATGWLAGSGVALHEVDGGVLCDEYLRTSVPGVFAAGDVAHFPNDLMDAPLMRLENWTAAAETGAAAAHNALADPRPFRTVPYVWSDWYGSRIQFVGVPAADETRVVVGDLDGPRFVALYRSGERVAGALAVGEPGKIMKYRRLIQQRASWETALDLYPSPV
jgi:NADPH-dependent 2,4-dienoyl-CoA reductase/sulfur reductase-like enzyme